MSNKFIKFVISFLPALCAADSMVEALPPVAEKLQEKASELPFNYNFTIMGGYFTMPSARLPNSGTAALGGTSIPPMNMWGVNVGLFNHLEVGTNYQVLRGISDTDRSGNVKLLLYKEKPKYPLFPSFAFGLQDFFGDKRFYTYYFAATKQFLPANLEVSLGWGHGDFSGIFGGATWTPFYDADIRYLKNFSVMAEYDAQRKGVNFGLVGDFMKLLQVKVASVGGKNIAASGVLHYDFDGNDGFFVKSGNPSLHTTPVDHEAIGILRTEKDLAYELSYALSEQRLDLYEAYITTGDAGENVLWLKVLNTVYRKEAEIRERLDYLLATLVPENIDKVTVIVDADGIPTQAYDFTRKTMTMVEVSAPPTAFEGTKIYHRRKKPWNLILRPRFLNYFGAATGKYEYSLGLLGGVEGYLFDTVYYKLILAYNIVASKSDFDDMQFENPSQLFNINTDRGEYYQGNTFSVDTAYLQQGYYIGSGWYGRWALGYFSAPFLGLGGEVLYYPVGSSFAIGISGANIYKRRYEGLGITTEVQKYDGYTPELSKFIGYQCFLDLHYNYKPLQLDLEANIGKFLARDFGARFSATRYFQSGTAFSVWYTVTGGNDHVNGRQYFDKGIALSVPFDFFLKKSSRTMLPYKVGSRLRDVGVMAQTGDKLYPTLQIDRMNW
ncbi:MAG: YjbH domain-containing protein [Simkaniaceae bacterium]|nr:YjbH domain-containing protein [Simkaniaceae bacterium]